MAERSDFSLDFERIGGSRGKADSYTHYNHSVVDEEDVYEVAIQVAAQYHQGNYHREVREQAAAHVISLLQNTERGDPYLIFYAGGSGDPNRLHEAGTLVHPPRLAYDSGYNKWHIRLLTHSETGQSHLPRLVSHSLSTLLEHYKNYEQPGIITGEEAVKQWMQQDALHVMRPRDERPQGWLQHDVNQLVSLSTSDIPVAHFDFEGRGTELHEALLDKVLTGGEAWQAQSVRVLDYLLRDDQPTRRLVGYERLLDGVAPKVPTVELDKEQSTDLLLFADALCTLYGPHFALLQRVYARERTAFMLADLFKRRARLGNVDTNSDWRFTDEPALPFEAPGIRRLPSTDAYVSPSDRMKDHTYLTYLRLAGTPVAELGLNDLDKQMVYHNIFHLLFGTANPNRQADVIANLAYVLEADHDMAQPSFYDTLLTHIAMRVPTDKDDMVSLAPFLAVGRVLAEMHPPLAYDDREYEELKGDAGAAWIMSELYTRRMRQIGEERAVRFNLVTGPKPPKRAVERIDILGLGSAAMNARLDAFLGVEAQTNDEPDPQGDVDQNPTDKV